MAVLYTHASCGTLTIECTINLTSAMCTKACFAALLAALLVGGVNAVGVDAAAVEKQSKKKVMRREVNAKPTVTSKRGDSVAMSPSGQMEEAGDQAKAKIKQVMQHARDHHDTIMDVANNGEALVERDEHGSDQKAVGVAYDYVRLLPLFGLPETTCEDEGYVTVTTATECSAAATKLNLTSTTVNENTYWDRPKGCTWGAAGNLELFTDGQINCRHYRYECICRTEEASDSVTYVKYSNKNAFNKRGGDDIDGDTRAPEGLSKTECEQRCTDDGNCDCVTYKEFGGKCWKRKNCKPADWQHGNDNFDVYMKATSVSKLTTVEGRVIRFGGNLSVEWCYEKGTSEWWSLYAKKLKPINAQCCGCDGNNQASFKCKKNGARPDCADGQNKNYHQAERFCEEHGMRLCTSQEIKNGAGWGSGCGLKSTYAEEVASGDTWGDGGMVWTKTQCSRYQ